MKLILSTAAVAASIASTVKAQSFGGELSAWAQSVIPTNTVQERGQTCDDNTSEMCESVAGGGLYAGGLFTLPGRGSLYADLTVDAHLASTDFDPAEAQENARYAGLGLHYIIDDGADPWGVYATVVGANNHVDNDDDSGVMLGVGAEKYWGTYYVQGGYMQNTAENSDNDSTLADDIDGMNRFGYFRTGSQWTLASGKIDGSVALGLGEATGPQDEAAVMTWVQLAAAYSAPIGDSDLEWFVGYQGDFVEGDDVDDSATERTMFNSLQFGVTMTFGDRQSPFKTPNFRGPISNAGELN